MARRWASLRHLLCSHLPSVKSQRWSVLPNLNNGQHCFFWRVPCTKLHPNENGCVLFFSGSFSYYNDMHVSCAFKREKKSFCMFTSPLYFNQIRLNSQFGRLQSESQEWSGSWRLYSSFSTLCYHPPNICIIKPRHMIKGYIAVNYHRDSGQKNPTGWNSEFNGASTLLLYTYKYDILITIMNSNKHLPRSPHCYWCLHHKPTVCDASALSTSLWFHGVIKPSNIRLSKIFPDYPVDNMEGLSNLWIIVK